MSQSDQPRFAVVGAGLGGALMAAYLGRAGYRVDVYERRPDPRAAGFIGGRSINLALSTRGLHALGEVGVADEVLADAIPMRGRMIHAPDGGLSFQPYDKDPSRCINSVSRGGLNITLLNAAERLPGVRLHFEQRCTDVDLDAPAILLDGDDADGGSGDRRGSQQRIAADVVLSADGAFSAVRGGMQRLDRFDYSQDYLAHGYKELCIPPTAAGDFAMEPNALHIWPRRSFMMIALPNPDGSFTCTLFLAFDGLVSFAPLKSDEDVSRFFEAQFPDAVPLMPTLLSDFRDNPTSSLVTVRCGPWHHRDRVVLLGDAAHAVVPFYGQGMNCAFEDCTVLNECLREHAGDLGRAFDTYYRRRKPNADALADLAIHNFIEMRDHAGSRVFRARKATERTLHRLLAGWYTPLYSMVSFSRVPYAEAVARARRQGRMVVAVVIALLVLIAVVAGILLWPKSP